MTDIILVATIIHFKIRNCWRLRVWKLLFWTFVISHPVLLFTRYSCTSYVTYGCENFIQVFTPFPRFLKYLHVQLSKNKLILVITILGKFIVICSIPIWWYSSGDILRVMTSALKHNISSPFDVKIMYVHEDTLFDKHSSEKSARNESSHCLSSIKCSELNLYCVYDINICSI